MQRTVSGGLRAFERKKEETNREEKKIVRDADDDGGVQDTEIGQTQTYIYKKKIYLYRKASEADGVVLRYRHCMVQSTWHDWAWFSPLSLYPVRSFQPSYTFSFFSFFHCIYTHILVEYPDPAAVKYRPNLLLFLTAWKWREYPV